MKNITNILTKLLDKIESDVTLELDEIKFSKKHGHDICVMHLIGKNTFPIMTADEILSNPKARAGLSNDDLILITRLDMEIKLKKNNLRVVERDRNGTVVLSNEAGERKRYAERLVSINTELLDKLNGKDAHGIGYRIGFQDGFAVIKQKINLGNTIRNFFKFTKRNG